MTVLIPAQAAGEERIGTPIDSGVRECERALNKQDARSLVSTYTEDTELLPTNQETIRGRDKIHSSRASVFGGVSETLIELKVLDITHLRRCLIEVGYYDIKSKETEMIDHGKYLVV